jgi:hypothetical protein
MHAWQFTHRSESTPTTRVKPSRAMCERPDRGAVFDDTGESPGSRVDWALGLGRPWLMTSSALSRYHRINPLAAWGKTKAWVQHGSRSGVSVLVPRSGADEQCVGARLAAGGDLASHQRGNRQRTREPVRGADAHGIGNVPAAGQQHAGLPNVFFRGRAKGPSNTLSCRPTHRQSQLPDLGYSIL